MPLSNEQIDVIVAAMLAVNRFPLLRAQELTPMLRAARLLDSDHVASVDLNTLTRELASAGYDRGALTSLFSRRLRALVEALRDRKLDALATALKDNDKASAILLLTTIDGIGPVVAATAWHLLRTIEDGAST